MDHYQTLGVAKNATQDDIKKAYRRMAGIHHPDKGGDTAQFQKIQEAYETLSNPQKKQEYDNPNPFGQGGGGGFHGGFPGGFHFSHGGMNINDLFGHMFGHGFQQRPQTPSYRTVVWLRLEQVYSGEDQVLQIQLPTGLQTLKISVPKGVENGAQIRYDNLIPNAHLLVEFRIHPHPQYERRGNDLYSDHEVSILDLIVGTEFEFKTISGKKLEVVIPPKTQPSGMMRIAGEGLPHDRGVGDQYILLKPFTPDIIDSSITDIILQKRSK